MKCPTCNTNELHEDEAMRALSRKDNQTELCDTCASKEALYELQGGRY